jgi:hypothetical protein
MSNRRIEEHGTHNRMQGSVSAHQCSTTNVFGCTSRRHGQQELATQYFFNHQYITNPTVSPESHVIAAAQQLATALKGNIPAGNEMGKSIKKGQQTLHKNSGNKKQGSKSQGTTQQSKSNTDSTKDNTLSKGGSINSKGGRRPRGRSSHRADSCKPARTTASCARPRNTFPIMVTAV